MSEISKWLQHFFMINFLWEINFATEKILLRHRGGGLNNNCFRCWLIS